MKSTSAFNIRPANTGDVIRLVDLVQAAYRGGKAKVSWKNEHDLVQGPRITAPEIHELIDRSTAALLTATPSDKQEIIGCVLVEKHSENEVHIGLLAVDPDCQNIGLGRVLLNAAEQYAVEMFNCTQATMFVLSGREELLDWYKRMGYQETGETKPFLEPESGVIAVDTEAHFRVISKELHRLSSIDAREARALRT